MSERVYLPSDKALGLDMPGVKYNTRRELGEGVVEVSDDHAALIRAYTGLEVGERFSAPDAPGVECVKCSFGQYAAMAADVCPRCGGQWAAQAAPVQSAIESGRRVKVYDI